MTKLQTEEPQTVSRTVHAAPTQRELLLLLAVSFVVFWMSLFLLHKSTDLVVHSGDTPLTGTSRMPSCTGTFMIFRYSISWGFHT